MFCGVWGCGYIIYILVLITDLLMVWFSGIGCIADFDLSDSGFCSALSWVFWVFVVGCCGFVCGWFGLYLVVCWMFCVCGFVVIYLLGMCLGGFG